MLATVITRRIQPGLERLQNATLREVRVEDLTLGALPLSCASRVLRAVGARSPVLTCDAVQGTRRRW